MRLLPFALACLLAVPLAPAATPIINDDAGSGRDAPDTPSGAIVDPLIVSPGVVYSGYTDRFLDVADVYSFHANAGDILYFDFAGPVGCVDVFAPNGTLHPTDSSCTAAYASLGGLSTQATVSGLWMVSYAYLEPQVYQFSIGIGAPGPSPYLIDTSALLFGTAGPLPGVTPASPSGPHTVVAVIDTGINPYHDFFAAPALSDHPSTWLAGFPASTPSVSLSLEAPSYSEALAADEATWESLSRGKLYTFPGTRVVGGISFSEYTADGTKPILDEHSHGTHSAGLALGANLPAAEGNVLVVMIEVGSGDFATGVAWAAQQPWIDAISLSAGTAANAPTNAQMPKASLAGVRAGKPVFIASGNGFSGAGVAPDHCTTYTSGYVGPAWVTRVGAAEPASNNPTYWHCLPVEIIARTDVGSPDYQSLALATVATGTSAATPNAMGAYARLLLQAKRASFEGDRFDVLEHLYNASEPAPTTVGPHDPSLEATAPYDQGYGLVDGATLSRALATLASGTATPRPELDTWFATDRAIRLALWGEEGDLGGGVGVEQNDAGSGGDAPGSSQGAVPIALGVVHHGLLTGILADGSDWYTFDANDGQRIRVETSGALHCVYLYDPDGFQIDFGCAITPALAGSIDFVAPSTGAYYVEISYIQPDAYGFAVALDAEPPTPTPV